MTKSSISIAIKTERSTIAEHRGTINRSHIQTDLEISKYQGLIEEESSQSQAMAGNQEVKLLGVVGSPFVTRAVIGLKLKGVEFEYVHESLQEKSEALLKYNPVHKKVPVLVHNGKPIVESMVIVEYVDEAWKGYSILPTDPYQKAQARFWVKFIDDKVNTLFLFFFF